VIDANEEKPDPGKQLTVVWKARRNVPKKPSLLLVNDLVFALDDGGIASCLDAKTGAEIWRERVSGNYSASPIYAAGRIYCFSEEGKCTVLQASREFKVLAENFLPDGFMASPAAVEGELYLRTRTALFRVGKSS
jgi:outer membrane protein assembly factor BamB